MRSVFYSIVGILLSGLAGGVAGWAVTALVGWNGTMGAFVAAVIGMVVATGVWIGITVLLRSLGLAR